MFCTSKFRCCRVIIIVSLLAILNPKTSVVAFQSGNPQNYYRITVVDEQTGRGVPLVELTTTNSITYITDSAGVIAFYEPGLMNTSVHFTIKSHGYTYPEDYFKIAGIALDIKPGGKHTIKIHRVNIAQRLYRTTGQGIYRDSILLGDTPPTVNPVINGLVTGQDSVLATIYKNKIFWIWGDTSRPAYPLGNFAASGATSELPGDKNTSGGLDPDIGINLNYFVNKKDGFSRGMSPIDGPGPVWLDGLMVITDDDDNNNSEKMIARYMRVKTLGELYEMGMVLYDDQDDTFKPIVQYNLDITLYARGHPFKVKVERGSGERGGSGGSDLSEGEAGGVEYYYYFASPYPNIRVKADMQSALDPNAYETYTCLKAGTLYKNKNNINNNTETEKNNPVNAPEIDRDPNTGKLIWGWKANTSPIGITEQIELLKSGVIKSHETIWNLRDIDTGKQVIAHGGSVYYNNYLNSWIMIILETYSPVSMLGEIWFAKADTPIGPWTYAKKIVTHNNYSFYNPKQHPFFDQDNGRIIYFEGTYTATFSGNLVQTPRYDYNQIMYKLLLDDPRLLSLPVPIYEMSVVDPATNTTPQRLIRSYKTWSAMNETQRSARNAIHNIPFYAISPSALKLNPATASGLIPVYCVSESIDNHNTTRLTTTNKQNQQPAFYALPYNNNQPETTAQQPATDTPIVPLYEYYNPATYNFIYLTAEDLTDVKDNDYSGYTKNELPICNVWLNPTSIMCLDKNTLPVF